MPDNLLVSWMKKALGNKSRRSRRPRSESLYRRVPAALPPALELLEDRIAPALWVVNVATDAATPTAGMLRYALTNAASGDVITFAPALNGSTIALAGTTGLTISQNVSIVGPGATNLTINGGNVATRPDFIVNAGVTASISGLTISGGLSSSGAGIRNLGTLSLAYDTISNNGVLGNTQTHTGAASITKPAAS